MEIGQGVFWLGVCLILREVVVSITHYEIIRMTGVERRDA